MNQMSLMKKNLTNLYLDRNQGHLVRLVLD